MIISTINALVWLSLFITGMMMLFSLTFRLERWMAGTSGHPLPILVPSFIIHLACWAWLVMVGVVSF
ncbi:MAG TPA: hypothetical protein PLL06_00240 [Acidobacteriota bacterium]|nr:hypothetical protein [Acidobacteriota bacterium]HNG91309.1 hypothetical protein [Acidobacteriota bacterium]